jgi:cytidylate kinase
MKKIVIAIDGYSACGKSTTAKIIAAELGYGFLDTGAMYRAVTYHLLAKGIQHTDTNKITAELHNIHISFGYNAEKQRNETFLNNVCVEDEIRTMNISRRVSEYSAVPEIRRFLVAEQQNIGKEKGIVAEGRDIGTVVFPDAEVKIFMTASKEVRAERRQAELRAKGENISLEDILQNLEKRDFIDSTREDSPLRQAKDAILLDTSHLNIEQQTHFILEKVTELMEAETSLQD